MIAADRRDEDRRYILRQQGAHLLLELLVNHIALGDGEQSLLIQKFGVVLRELAQQDVVVVLDVVAVGRDHKEQHRVTLDVAQESCTDTLALVRTLDNSRDVGHNE